MDYNVNKEELDACHRLKDKEHAIEKFCQKKDCEKVPKAKNDLQKLTATNLYLPEGSRIFVNRSLCYYYRWLSSTRKKLHDKVKIFGWYISKESIKKKLREDNRLINISHIEDFKKYFPM